MARKKSLIDLNEQFGRIHKATGGEGARYERAVNAINEYIERIMKSKSYKRTFSNGKTFWHKYNFGDGYLDEFEIPIADKRKYSQRTYMGKVGG